MCGASVSDYPSLCPRQSDVDMWAALEAVQMKEYIKALPEGLDAPVSEGGGNLSVRFTATQFFVALLFLSSDGACHPCCRCTSFIGNLSLFETDLRQKLLTRSDTPWQKPI